RRDGSRRGRDRAWRARAALRDRGDAQGARPRSLRGDARRVSAAAGGRERRRRADRPRARARRGVRALDAGTAHRGPAPRWSAALRLHGRDRHQPRAWPPRHRLRVRGARRAAIAQRLAGRAERHALGRRARVPRARAPAAARRDRRAHRRRRGRRARDALRRDRAHAREPARRRTASERRMNEALLVSNIVLWIVVAVLAGVVLALARQLGVLYERVAPAGALVLGQGPAVGDRAPVVTATALGGAALEIGAASPDGRSTLVFFLSPTCPVCKTLLPVLRSIARREQRRLRLVLASDGTRGEHEEFVREQGLDRLPYVLSPTLGITYQ